MFFYKFPEITQKLTTLIWKILFPNYYSDDLWFTPGWVAIQKNYKILIWITFLNFECRTRNNECRRNAENSTLKKG